MAVLVHVTPRSGAKLIKQPTQRVRNLAVAIASGEADDKAEALKSAIRSYVSDLSEIDGTYSSHRAPRALAELVSELDDILEIDRFAESMVPERVAQPSETAIAARYIKPFRAYLAKLFAYPIRPLGDMTDIENFRSLDGWDGFASAFFWAEVDSIIERELKPNIEAAFSRIIIVEPDQKVRIKGSTEAYLASNENRLFSVEAFNVYWGHCICRVHEKDQPQFEQMISQGLALDELDDIAQVVCWCSCAAYVSKLREAAHANWEKIVVDFINQRERNDNVEFYRTPVYKSPCTDDNLKYLPGDVIPPSKDSAKPTEERLELLDAFTAEHPGEPISQFVQELFPELLSPKHEPRAPAPPLPKKAPERWPSDPSKRTENPAEFATRIYRVWMDAEVLTRQFLKEIDPLLFASLDNWLKHNKRKANPSPLPEGFKLLSQQEVNDKWVERVTSGQEPYPMDPDELRRFGLALRYRGRGEALKG